MPDRRTVARRQADHPVVVRVVPAAHSPSQALLVQDLSTAGLGTLGSRPLAPETPVLLDLPGVGLRAGRVVHATPSADGLWVAGFTLLVDLESDEVRILLG
jgi:hypothetical protein